MAGWGEVAPDTVLSLLYLFLLLRLATSSDAFFRTPFYVFFVSTGIYSIISTASYHIAAQFSYTENSWTVYIFKTCFILNVFGAEASTFGKMFIAIHRYYVLRTKDFTEKNWSGAIVTRVLVAQFVLSLLLTGPVWPSGYVTASVAGRDVIISLAYINTMILKAFSTTTYFSYSVSNIIFTILTSRELARLRTLLKDNADTERSIIVQQRNMFIVVTVCSLSHLIKAVQQFVMAITTYLHLDSLTNAIWPYYPIANGLASYAAPIFLVIFARKVRSRVLFLERATNSTRVSGVISSSDR